MQRAKKKARKKSPLAEGKKYATPGNLGLAARA
jgi:hypothetical protein